jgi:hypothetical protein
VSITKFYEPSTGWTQCKLVNRAFGQTTCCAAGSSSVCDKPWYGDHALTITGHLASVIPRSLSLAEVKTEILGGRPISIAIYWIPPSTGGHNPVIDGFDLSTPSAPTIDVEDPWWGLSVCDFNTFPTTYQGGATWGYSFLTK